MHTQEELSTSTLTSLSAENSETYVINDSEFNLAMMEINTIKKAFRLFPKEPMTVIAGKLCISSRTLHRKMKDYKLGSPRDLRYPETR